MQHPIPPDAQDLIAAQLGTGRYQNEDEVLREAQRALQEASDDAAAVQDAMAANCLAAASIAIGGHLVAPPRFSHADPQTEESWPTRELFDALRR